MIIKCKRLISATTKEELEVSAWLTKEKEYVVLTLKVSLRDGIMVILQSDQMGDPFFQKLEGFEIISQKIPKNWGVKVENDYSYLMPKSWMYAGFLEDLEDEEPRAMNLFKKEVEIMYREEGLL